MEGPVSSKIYGERKQGHATRSRFYSEISKVVNRPIISLFTSFTHPVMLTDDDATVLEDTLGSMDLSEGLAILINSPGGDILSAERIIRACKEYSRTDDYWAIIPGKAKSAATAVCLGASKLFMAGTSELGPVGPQLTAKIEGERRRLSLRRMVRTYEELFEEAKSLNLEEENMEPYVQQLDNFDAREISQFKSGIEGSESITVKALSECMMRGKSKEKIRENIKVFLEPEETKVHGRPIYYEEAKKCNLNVEKISINSKEWTPIHELYLRLDDLVSSTEAAKCIESENYFFTTSPPPS